LKIQGSSLADDSRIKSFFKGVYRLKPPKAKYDCIWDPKIVLNYFSNLNSNDNLSLDELSKKLVIGSCHRSSYANIIFNRYKKYLDKQ